MPKLKVMVTLYLYPFDFHFFMENCAEFGLVKLCSGTECVVSMPEARGIDRYIALEVFSMNFGVSDLTQV